MNRLMFVAIAVLMLAGKARAQSIVAVMEGNEDDYSQVSDYDASTAAILD